VGRLFRMEKLARTVVFDEPAELVALESQESRL
jgi:hypothetical protein